MRILIAAIFVGIASTSVLAGPVFRCKRPDGTVVYQDSQCSTGAGSVEPSFDPEKTTISQQQARAQEEALIRQRRSDKHDRAAAAHQKQREQIVEDARERGLASRMENRKAASIAPVSFEWSNPLHRSPLFAIDHHCVLTITHLEDDYKAPCGAVSAFLGDVELLYSETPVLLCIERSNCIVWVFCEEHPPAAPRNPKDVVNASHMVAGVSPTEPTYDLRDAIKTCAGSAPPPAFTARLRAAGGDHPREP